MILTLALTWTFNKLDWNIEGMVWFNIGQVCLDIGQITQSSMKQSNFFPLYCSNLIHAALLNPLQHTILCRIFCYIFKTLLIFFWEYPKLKDSVWRQTMSEVSTKNLYLRQLNILVYYKCTSDNTAVWNQLTFSTKKG